MKVKKLLIKITIFICCISQFQLLGKAQVPYYSYTTTEWSTQAASIDAYVPVESYNGEESGCGSYKEPSDFCIDGDKIYVLDKGNNRIVVLTKDFKLINGINNLNNHGQPDKLDSPEGIYVKNNKIYVADYGNSRAIKMDMQGNIEVVINKPDNSAYTADFFKPKKIMADEQGTIYIIAESIYQGILMYSSSGNFISFFGSPKIQVTPKLIADRIWKSILSSKQSDFLERYVPIEFTDFDIDKDGFIYTCSFYTKSNVEQIRRLNYVGDNIYPFQGNFGEQKILYVKGNQEMTRFLDIAVNNDNFLYAMDSQRQRVYVFDKEGTRLFTFGSEGNQLGTFQRAVALSVVDNSVYILDAAKGNITIYEPNEFGKTILKATLLYSNGQYEESKQLWDSIIKLNGNYELAYRGMGEAYLKTGDFKNAIKYFRVGYDRAKESNAFGLYRSEVLRSHIVLIFIGIVILIIGLFIVTDRKLMAKFKKK